MPKTVLYKVWSEYNLNLNISENYGAYLSISKILALFDSIEWDDYGFESYHEAITAGYLNVSILEME